MDAVKTILERSGCSQYVQVFQEKGYDSAGHLMSMGPNDLKELQKECGVLTGHMHRLRNMLHAMKNRAHEANAEPTAAAAASATTESSMAPDKTNSEDPGMSETKDLPVLKQAHYTWAQARLASYEFSTRCGCKALLDNKNCGGKRKIILCSSVLSKKSKGAGDSEEEEEKIPCPHKLYWKKNKGSGEQ